MDSKIFILKDADFDVSASFRPAIDSEPALVTIMDPDRDAFITMRVDDLVRLTAAAAKAAD